MLLSMQGQKEPKRGRPKGATTFDAAAALAFGAVVRSRRLEIGISQEELAGLVPLERSHMGKIERGEHSPSLTLMLKLARALNLRPGELLDQAAARVDSAGETA